MSPPPRLPADLLRRIIVLEGHAVSAVACAVATVMVARGDGWPMGWVIGTGGLALGVLSHLAMRRSPPERDP